MSDSSHSLPPDPVLRFRVRSLLWVTTAVAILATIAGPYYRRQPPRVQDALLVYWTCVGVFVALGLWGHWRKYWQRSRPASEITFVLWSSPSRFWGNYSRLAIDGGCLMIEFAWVAMSSTHIADRVGRSAIGWLGVALQACLPGIVIAGFLFSYVRKPVFVTAKGISAGGEFNSWERIRTAEWAWSRHGVVRFHRLDGDLYATVPTELRAAVETYLRQRTNFIGRSVTAGE